MTFYLNVIKTRLKLTINKFFIMSILLYAMFVTVTIWNFGETDENLTKIGFLYEENNFTNNLINQFDYYGEDFFVSVKYETEEQLQNDVAKNKIDCGYILPDEYTNSKNSIKYISSNKTILGSYSNLLIGSIYLQSNAGNLGYKAVRNILDDDAKIIKQKINESNEQYLKNAPFLTYNYEGVNGNEIVENNNIYTILYGIIGLFLTLFCLLFYLNERFENNVKIYLALRNKSNRIKYYFGNLTAYYIILFIFSFVNVTIIKFIFTNEMISLAETVALILFCFMLSSAVYSLTLIKNHNVMSLFIVFYFLTACILGNVFFDINSIVPYTSFTKYLYTTYYFKESMLQTNSIATVFIIISSTLFNILNLYTVKNINRMI